MPQRRFGDQQTGQPSNSNSRRQLESSRQFSDNYPRQAFDSGLRQPAPDFAADLGLGLGGRPSENLLRLRQAHSLVPQDSGVAHSGRSPDNVPAVTAWLEKIRSGESDSHRPPRRPQARIEPHNTQGVEFRPPETALAGTGSDHSRAKDVDIASLYKQRDDIEKEVLKHKKDIEAIKLTLQSNEDKIYKKEFEMDELYQAAENKKKELTPELEQIKEDIDELMNSGEDAYDSISHLYRKRDRINSDIELQASTMQENDRMNRESSKLAPLRMHLRDSRNHLSSAETALDALEKQLKEVERAIQEYAEPGLPGRSQTLPTLGSQGGAGPLEQASHATSLEDLRDLGHLQTFGGPYLSSSQHPLESQHLSLKEALSNANADIISLEAQLDKAVHSIQNDEQRVQRAGPSELHGDSSSASIPTASPLPEQRVASSGEGLESGTRQSLREEVQSDREMPERNAETIQEEIQENEEFIDDMKESIDQFNRDFPHFEEIEQRVDGFLEELEPIERTRIKGKFKEGENLNNREIQAKEDINEFLKENDISDIHHFKELQKGHKTVLKILEATEKKSLELHSELSSIQAKIIQEEIRENEEFIDDMKESIDRFNHRFPHFEEMLQRVDGFMEKLEYFEAKRTEGEFKSEEDNDSEKWQALEGIDTLLKENNISDIHHFKKLQKGYKTILKILEATEKKSLALRAKLGIMTDQKVLTAEPDSIDYNDEASENHHYARKKDSGATIAVTGTWDDKKSTLVEN